MHGNSGLSCPSFPDKCRPAPECRSGTPGPLAVDVDMAFVVDSSHSVSTDVYHAALHLVDTMLDNLEVAAQPDASLYGARVALVMHTTPGFWPGAGQPPVLEAFLLTSYGHRIQMQRHIREAMGHLLQGAPALGYALEWTLEKVLLAAPLPRRAQVLFAIVASETSSWDREKLRTLSLEAKCKGITLFVLALGPGVGTRELAELAGVASAPSEQHLLHLQGISDPEVAYARRFTWAFLNLLKSEQSLSTGMPGGNGVGRTTCTACHLGKQMPSEPSSRLRCMQHPHHLWEDRRGAPRFLKTLSCHCSDTVPSLMLVSYLEPLSWWLGSLKSPLNLLIFSFTKMKIIISFLFVKPTFKYVHGGVSKAPVLYNYCYYYFP